MTGFRLFRKPSVLDPSPLVGEIDGRPVHLTGAGYIEPDHPEDPLFDHVTAAAAREACKIVFGPHWRMAFQAAFNAHPNRLDRYPPAPRVAIALASAVFITETGFKAIGPCLIAANAGAGPVQFRLASELTYYANHMEKAS